MTHPVRVAGSGDVGAIGQLLHDFNAEFGEPTPSPAALAERIEGLTAGGDTVVLLAGDRPAGLAGDRPAGLAGDRPAGLAVLRFRAAIWSTGAEC
ncbi:MAG: hypothetical protein ACRDX8_07820, partial [Acidimicrobiales bacterium]